MRVTNSMITEHSKVNINGTKELVDKYNTQMTDQKKINKPSDDPVVAIRSLRLRNTLSEVNQYYEKNIPDAESWLDVTETALKNMSQIVKDVYTQCVNGSNDTLTAEDRNIILKNLTALKNQLYAEGNADYAGRTIFTGYKTNQSLTYSEPNTSDRYSIQQQFDINDVTSKNYFTDVLKLPTNDAQVQGGIAIADEMKQVTCDRIRIAYEGLDSGVAPTITVNGATLDGMPITYQDSTGTTVTGTATVATMSYANWYAADFAIADNQVLFIPETGELVLGKGVSQSMKADAKTNPDWKMNMEYQKKGFEKGDVRPEMYFNCTNLTDIAHPVTYTRQNQNIEYLVSENQLLKVNTQAGEDGILSTAIGRDIDELKEAVSAAIAANDKVDKIKEMMLQTKYADDVSQAGLKKWLEAANKEKAFADDTMQKLYGSGQTGFQNYQKSIDLETTDVGSRDDRLKLTKNRMQTQQSTIKKLISDNENRNQSDILIDYKSAYTAYESALTAASKANSMTLLDYL